MDMPGPMTINTSLSDVKPGAGSVPMEGLVNFDLGGHNEFMDLLDMVNSDAGTDENRSHFDFSSLGPLPDEFLGFDFDSDAADKWPTLTTGLDTSYDFRKSPKSLTPLHTLWASAPAVRKGECGHR